MHTAAPPGPNYSITASETQANPWKESSHIHTAPKGSNFPRGTPQGICQPGRTANGPLLFNTENAFFPCARSVAIFHSKTGLGSKFPSLGSANPWDGNRFPWDVSAETPRAAAFPKLKGGRRWASAFNGLTYSAQGFGAGCGMATKKAFPPGAVPGEARCRAETLGGRGRRGAPLGHLRRKGSSRTYTLMRFTAPGVPCSLRGSRRMPVSSRVAPRSMTRAWGKAARPVLQ